MTSIQELIKEICEEENISFHLISNDWIIVLEKDGKTHYIAGNRFDLNNYVSARICNDKYACFDALKYHHVPVCEYHIFYPEDDKEIVKEYFDECRGNVVVKANKGSFGNQVFHTTSFEDCLEKMDFLFQNNPSISISPFYDIQCEYRVIVLDGEVLLLFGKKRPVVTGTGMHTIYELLYEFNEPYFKDLEDHSDLDVVLPKDEVYEYGWQFNISKGSIPFKVEDQELMEKLSLIAKDATDKLQLRFVSVDIVELENKELKVLEINSGVVTNICDYFEDGEELAKNVYRSAILKMFES